MLFYFRKMCWVVWMLGGNANFHIDKQIGYQEANFGFQVYPKIGYFFTDRMALTLESYRWDKIRSEDLYQQVHWTMLLALLLR